MTTAKEDEVTSSEEAATVDVRLESKGVRINYNIVNYFPVCHNIRFPTFFLAAVVKIQTDCLFIIEELINTRLAPPVITSISSEYTMQGLSLLPTENIYEFAAKLLFFAVRWARSIHSFLQVSSNQVPSFKLLPYFSFNKIIHKIMKMHKVE